MANETIDLTAPDGRDKFKRAQGGQHLPATVQNASVKSYHASLPYPPQANHLYTICRGRKILSSKGRAYRAEVEAYRPTIGTFTGRLIVEIHAYMPDNRRRDLSNIIKSLEDAMTCAGFWNDDSQIDNLSIKRCGVEKPGRVEVFIQEK